MAHDKVYGICESKCQVEVLPKDRAFGIAKTEIIEGVRDYIVTMPIGQSNVRHIVKNYSGIVYKVNDTSIFTEGYNFQVVYFKENGFMSSATPGGMVAIYDSNDVKIPVKFITPYNFKLSNYTTVHFNFFWDGLNLCCRCEGYVN